MKPHSASSRRLQRALKAFQSGELVVVADDDDRENEGDLIQRADSTSSDSLAFMIRHTSGIVCVAMSGERLDELGLPLMVAENSESFQTAFTISVDYKFGTSTGISASDRSKTIRALADAGVPGRHFARPGHVFPLRARAGGVLERRGHTEAAVDLARLVAASPAATLCELVNDDGSMLRGAALERFAQNHGLAYLTIEDLASYRKHQERSAKSTHVTNIGNRVLRPNPRGAAARAANY